MSVSMPSLIVLIVCRTVLAPGAPDPNAGFTNHEYRLWATEHSMMACRRKEVSVDGEGKFTTTLCQRTSMMEAARWDVAHRVYKTWRAACPTKIINTITGEIIGWQIPGCSQYRDVMRCENDTAV